MSRDDTSTANSGHDFPDDSDHVKFYRRKSPARIKATTVFDVFVEMLLAGKGEILREQLHKNDFEMRAPPELVNLIKAQIVDNEVHTSSRVLAEAARSDTPRCPSWPVPQWNTAVLIARNDPPEDPNNPNNNVG